MKNGITALTTLALIVGLLLAVADPSPEGTAHGASGAVLRRAPTRSLVSTLVQGAASIATRAPL
jgi:hypothetical protein